MRRAKPGVKNWWRNLELLSYPFLIDWHMRRLCGLLLQHLWNSVLARQSSGGHVGKWQTHKKQLRPPSFPRTSPLFLSAGGLILLWTCHSCHRPPPWAPSQASFSSCQTRSPTSGNQRTLAPGLLALATPPPPPPRQPPPPSLQSRLSWLTGPRCRSRAGTPRRNQRAMALADRFLSLFLNFAHPECLLLEFWHAVMPGFGDFWPSPFRL